MPFRWRQKSIADDDITSSREFDIAYSNYADVINGGMDRDNLPKDCINSGGLSNTARNEFKQFSVGRFKHESNVNAHALFTTILDGNFTGGGGGAQPNPQGNSVYGLHYGDNPLMEGGSWFKVKGTEVQCEEGMLETNWKVNVFIPKYRAYVTRGTSDQCSMKWVEWRIDVDGVEVCRSSAMFQPWHTVMLNANTQIGKGVHTVDVYCLVPGRINDTDNQAIMTFFGGQLACWNRRR